MCVDHEFNIYYKSLSWEETTISLKLSDDEANDSPLVEDDEPEGSME